MSLHSWRVDTNQGKQRVTLAHNYWTTRQVIRVDGAVIIDKTPLSNLENSYSFYIENQSCTLTVGQRFWVLRVKYVLEVEGKVIPEMRVRKGS